VLETIFESCLRPVLGSAFAGASLSGSAMLFALVMLAAIDAALVIDNSIMVMVIK
jgi:hypothetical protein